VRKTKDERKQECSVGRFWNNPLLQKIKITMADGRAQMSRVQRELLELKQRGRVKTQADKLKDCKWIKVFPDLHIYAKRLL
jgi:hypothetical protein